MKQKVSFLVISLTLILTINSGLAVDVILMNQDFNSSWSTQTPPTGWTIYYNTPVGNSDWHRRQAQTPWSDNPTGYACLYQTPQELGDDILTSPVVNCSLYTNVVLRCSTYWIPQEGFYTAKLQGSSDGGANWLDIFNYYGLSIGPALQAFDCPWANNKPNVKFRWYFSGNTNQIYHWSIDNVSVTAQPIIYDVGATAIVAPTGVVDSGSVVTPIIRVKNFGNVAVSFPVIFRIGSFYNDMKQVTNLNVGESTYVYFAQWTANQVGNHLMRCTTALAYDGNKNNDTLRGQVSVRVRDIAVLTINTPFGIIDSSGTITPQATVKNCGSSTEIFNVTMIIGTNYIQTRIKTLIPGATDTVNFIGWFTSRGYHAVRCSTFLYNDVNPLNDTASTWVDVRVKDVGVTEILAPTGIVDSGVSVVPQATIQNFGTNLETFPVTFSIGAWTQVINKTLSSGETLTVTFPTWTARTSGRHSVVCYTSLDGDQVTVNDAHLDSVMVQVRDIGIASLVEPENYVRPETIIPQIWIRNYGSVSSGTFDIRLDISPAYSDTQLVANVNPGDSLLISFDPWADSLGAYTLRCTVNYIGDCNPSNNYITKTIVVSWATEIPGSWAELSKMIPGERPVKAGSCLNAINDTLLYLVKGNKTFDFYQFNTVRDSWAKKTNIPNGLSFKPTKKGARLASDGKRFLYFLKGGNTIEFFRFDTENDSWKELKDVPLGAGKKIKDGSALIYVEKDNGNFLYLLKGSKTREFYCFDIGADTWRRLPDAPAGLKPGYKKGSALAYCPGNELIYCLKDKSNEMFMYDVMADSWLLQHLPSMPLIHPFYRKTKKVKDGAALCYQSGNIFAFKGGNTPEFWLFTPIQRDSGVWAPLTIIPEIGSDGKKRRIKDGSDMVAAAYHDNPALLVIKGNKTDRLWRWADTSSKFLADKPVTTINNTCGNTEKMVANFKITPNPVRNQANIYYNLPNIKKATLKLYNVIGNAVKEYVLTKDKGILMLDAEKLPAGVYLMKLDAGKYNVTKKIILSH